MEQTMTKNELASILLQMYKKDKATGIHLFGIKYASDLDRLDTTNAEMIKLAGLKSSYFAELAKGRRLAKWVILK